MTTTKSNALSYKYKFNVLYHRVEIDDSDTCEFVTYITEVLERRNMKGYFADRDMLPGQSLVRQPFEIMDMSEYTILVLDMDFIYNDWSNFWSEVGCTLCNILTIFCSRPMTAIRSTFVLRAIMPKMFSSYQSS